MNRIFKFYANPPAKKFQGFSCAHKTGLPNVEKCRKIQMLKTCFPGNEAMLKCRKILMPPEKEFMQIQDILQVLASQLEASNPLELRAGG